MIDALSTPGLINSGVVDVLWNHGWREPKPENFSVHGIDKHVPTVNLPKNAVICCHTQSMTQVVQHLPDDGKYIIICRDTDGDFDSHLARMLRSSVKQVFAVNVTANNPLVCAIPYVMNTETDYHRPWENSLSIPRQKKNDVLVSFSTSPYRSMPKHERFACINNFTNKPWATMPGCFRSGELKNMPIDPEEYLIELRSHSYLAAPIGYGFERIAYWEAMFLGTIPICLKHPAILHFADMPFAFIDNWAEVTPEWCEKNIHLINRPIDKMKLSYWVDKIGTTKKALL